MSREEVKRIERGVQKRLKADGDHCSVCRRALEHGDKTFYGRIAGRRAAVTGECCASSLNLTIGMGIYTDREYDVLQPTSGKAPRPETSENVARIVDGVRSMIGETDALASAIARRAGLPTRSAATYLKETAWKADDAAWFEARPDRSHRLRTLLEGEFEALPESYRFENLPEGHELQVLVRQVAPGQRVRTMFGRNLSIPISDEEAVIHALFDLVFQRPHEADPTIGLSDLTAAIQRRTPTGRPS